MNIAITLCYLVVVWHVHAQKAPNIVIFIADDMGIGDLGCYGNYTIKTPNIDYIAENGITFTHNLAGESVCTPSRAALLTGRYAKRHGLSANKDECRVILRASSAAGLPPSEKTFATALKEKHYTTGYFGKWHLGIHCDGKDFCHFPLKHGFDYYYGMPLTNVQDCNDINLGSNETTRATFLFINAKLFLPTLLFLLLIFQNFNFPCKSVCSFIVAYFFTLWALDILHWFFIRHTNCVVMRNYDVVEQPVDLQLITKKLTHEVKSFINNKKEDKFLITVSYHHVHTALKTDKDFEGHSKHGKYGDAVEELDWSVGEILKHLQKLNLLQDTFVYFTSDHGPALYMTVVGEYHGGWKKGYKGGKSSSFEGGIRVPTVAMWPNVIPKHTVYNHPTSGLDLYPTLLSLANVKHASKEILDGVDITEVLKGNQKEAISRFIYHYCGAALEAVTYTPPNQTFIWKLHYQIPKPNIDLVVINNNFCSCFGDDVILLEKPILFNLLEDPTESYPLLVNLELYREVSKHISDAVKTHKNDIKPVEQQLSRSKNSFSFKRQMWCNSPFYSC